MVLIDTISMTSLLRLRGSSSLILTTILLLLTTTTQISTAQLTSAISTQEWPTFLYPTEYGNVTFVPTLARDTGDLIFHFEAPAVNSWAAVGVGAEMRGSLIFTFYRNLKGSGVTLCSRTTDSNVEPAHIPNSGCALISQEGVQNGIVSRTVTEYENNAAVGIVTSDYIIANVRCKNLVKTATSSPVTITPSTNKTGVEYQYSKPYTLPQLDPQSTAQPFIFALGPTDRRIRSNNKGVPLRRHVMFGHFRMDVSKAVVETTSDVPMNELAAIGTWTNRHATREGGPTQRDRGGWEGTVHASLMASAIVILFPVGVIFLRLLDMVKPHAYLQAIGCVFVVAGAGVGVYAGMFYNQTRRVNTHHQILGFIVVGLTLIQFCLGLTHHHFFAKKGLKSLMGRIHVPLGSVILLAGAANGFVGFKLTSSTYHYIIYAVMVIFVAVGLTVALFWIKVVRKREMRRWEDRREAERGFEEGKVMGAGDVEGGQVDARGGDVRDGA
ncbi:iron reductase domain protein, partial [Sporormia fimetaria CBS 119925]